VSGFHQPAGTGGWEGVRKKGNNFRDGEPRRSHYAVDYGAGAAHRGSYGEPKNPRLGDIRRLGNHGPRVSVEPIRGLLGPVIAELGLPTVAALARLQPRSIWRIMHEARLCTAILADRLITDVLDDPSLWYTTPGLELRDQYGRLL
jgi:hypothetical protein